MMYQCRDSTRRRPVAKKVAMHSSLGLNPLNRLSRYSKRSSGMYMYERTRLRAKEGTQDLLSHTSFHQEKNNAPSTIFMYWNSPGPDFLHCSNTGPVFLFSQSYRCEIR